jgi:FlaA1/EpsC-like NDP-sugar epimerase
MSAMTAMPARPQVKKTAVRRILFFIAADMALVSVALYAAFVVRFEIPVPTSYWASIPKLLGLLLVVRLASNSIFRLYNLTWRFVGTRDMVNVLFATVLGTLLWIAAAYALHDLLRFKTPPRFVIAGEFMFTLFGIGALRAAKRIWQVVTISPSRRGSAVRRVLVVGAGRAGEKLVREMIQDRLAGLRPVVVVDDDPRKRGTYLHGIRVVGGRDLIPRLVRDERVDDVMIAMPSAPGQVIREVVNAARTAGVPSVSIIPGMAAMLEGKIALASVREVKVEDLLGRQPVELDAEAIGAYLYGRTVLVTGAAGSIGSELVRIIASFDPGHLVLLEKDETRLFGLELDLRRIAPRVPVYPVVADVRDAARMDQVFRQFEPQVVFHAAAYKHVPMMEAHPEEAVTTNVLGTRAVAEAAAEYGAEAFVMISTDKAVNPTSVMGATKRVSEMVVRRLNETTATRFMAVRFGNVLGSRGSLIPILEEQIKRGGPITVTHPEMERYFMTSTEAARLILKAGSIGQGGEVFVLDMGNPVRVLDLAEALIRLSGLEPDVDVTIQFTGTRPGEKLREEVLLAEEGTVATGHDQIFTGILGEEPDPDGLDRALGQLADAAEEGDARRIRLVLQDLVRTYRPGPGAGDEPIVELLEGPLDGGNAE